MDLYIYSDESGVFDYIHNAYFIFAGVIFFSKQKDNPTYSKTQLASICEIGTTRVSQNIFDLKAMGKIERVGANKNCYWKVTK